MYHLWTPILINVVIERTFVFWHASDRDIHINDGLKLELVSKELNHLAAILHVYAWDLSFMK